MAKYTMLLAEYLERGGQLPATFSLIQGFEDIFKKHYCDKEIGFETELLFFMKLDEKADLYMQLYADKLTRLAHAYDLFDAGAKIRYTIEDNAKSGSKTLNAGAQHEELSETKGAEHEETSFTGGAQHTEGTELPFDSETAEPNIVNDSAEYTNTNEVDRDQTINTTETDRDAYENGETFSDEGSIERRETETGGSLDELQRRIEFVNGKARSLIYELLNEFKNCFMGVY